MGENRVTMSLIKRYVSVMLVAALVLTGIQVPVTASAANVQDVELKVGETKKLEIPSEGPTVTPTEGATATPTSKPDGSDTTAPTPTAGGSDTTATPTPGETTPPTPSAGGSETTKTTPTGETPGENEETTVSAPNAAGVSITWTTSDSTVVTVDADGNITGVKVGKAVVTAEVNGVTYTWNVTVVPATTETTETTPTPTATVTEGATATPTVTEGATATATPAPTGETTVTPAVTEGATVTVTATPTVTATATPAPAKAKSIKLNATKLTLAKNASVTLKATVKASNSKLKKVTWKASNSKVTVKNGKVTAKKAGKAVVYATAGGKTAKCTVTVLNKPSYKITYKLNKGTNNGLNPSYIAKGQKVTFKAPTRKGYTFKGWYVNNKKVKSIKGSKKVTVTAKWTKVKVSATKVKSLKAGSKKFTVKYNKVKGAKGYEIKYSTSSKFTKKTTKTVTVTGTSKTIKSLKKGKTYYVKVRAYKLDSAGNKVYSKATKVQKVKVK